MWTIAVLACASFVEGSTPLNADGEWRQFRWYGAEGSFTSLEGPFEFTVPAGSIGTVDVTDAFEIGDQFLVTEGTSALATTLAPGSGTDFTRDPDLAFSDAKWSSGSFVFAAGDHSIDTETIVRADGLILGGAFLRLSIATLPSISWTTPDSIQYGTPLSTAELNAIPPSGVSGALVYDPPLGTVLDAAAAHTLTVTFFPGNAVYSEIRHTVPIEVLRAPLTITANSTERPTGSANPAFTASYAGLVNGDSPSSLDTPPAIFSSATIDSPPGEYPIAVTSANDANYNITFVPGVLTVSGQQTPELTWQQPSSITYGQALGSEHLNAVVSGNVPGTFSYSPSVNTVLSAGLDQTLSVVFTPADGRYSNAALSVDIDVLPAPLTITADHKIKTLGSSNPPLTVHYSGFVHGDTSANLNSPVVVTTTADSNSPVGVYPIVASGATSNNYTIQFVAGMLEITDRLIPQVTWENPAPITYGTALTSVHLNAQVSAADGTFIYTPPAGEVLNAGTHQLAVEFVPSDPGRYHSATQSVTIVVQPAPLSIRADDMSRAPGFANSALTATYTGFVNGDTVSDLDQPAILTTTAATNSPPGSYPIVVSAASDANYAVTFQPGTLTITDKPVPGLEWSTPAPITYGEPLTELQLAASADPNIAGTFTFSPPLGTILGAGLHTLQATFTPTETARFDTATITASLDVIPASLTIRADDQTAVLASSITGIDFVTIGDPNNPPSLHDDGFGNDVFYGAVDEVFEIGKYETTNALYAEFLNAVAKDDPNELFFHSMADEARGGIIRSGEAPNFSYQTKPVMDNKPVLYVSFWDACRFCNWLHNGKPTGSQNAFTTEDGAYTLTDASALRDNTVTRNPGARFYLPTEHQWHKAAFYDPTKNNLYWTYGNRNDAIPDQALANAQGDITNQTGNVANWGRSADWDSNQNGVIENMIVFEVIGPEDGNVTSVGSGGSGSGSYYGAADMSGNVGEWTETPVGSFGRILRGGTWNSPQSLLTKNYRVPAITTEEIREVGFRIARDPTEGDEWILPPLTVQYQGFVNGDTAADLDSPVVVTTSATASSGPGVYPIIPQSASSANYMITFEPGTLTLTALEKLAAELTWPMPSSIQYGTPLSAQQLNAAATLETVSIDGTFTYTPPLDTVLDSGQHELSVLFEPADTQAYKSVSATTTIDVTQASLVIRVLDASRDEGAANPSFSASYEGFVNGDTEFTLATAVSFQTEATVESPPGSYPIIASTAADPNYTITFEQGTLTVLSTEPPALPQLEFHLERDSDQLRFQWQDTQNVSLVISDDLLTWSAPTDEMTTVENGIASAAFSILGLQERYFRLQRN